MWRQIRLDLELNGQKLETKLSKIIQIFTVLNESVGAEPCLSLFYQLCGRKLTLYAARVEANVILEMYLIFPSPCVFQGSFVIENGG